MPGPVQQLGLRCDEKKGHNSKIVSKHATDAAAQYGHTASGMSKQVAEVVLFQAKGNARCTMHNKAAAAQTTRGGGKAWVCKACVQLTACRLQRTADARTGAAVGVAVRRKKGA